MCIYSFWHMQIFLQYHTIHIYHLPYINTHRLTSLNSLFFILCSKMTWDVFVKAICLAWCYHDPRVVHASLNWIYLLCFKAWGGSWVLATMLKYQTFVPRVHPQLTLSSRLLTNWLHNVLLKTLTPSCQHVCNGIVVFQYVYQIMFNLFW